jgi:outer membrane protein assembly factor BamB
MRRLLSATSAAVVLATTVFAGSAAAKPFPDVIVLPGATSAEGIATGIGSTFYAGDLFAGDIYRGDLRGGTASLFIDAPADRMAAGLKVDVAHNLLVVAGFLTGQAYFYDARTGADRAVVQLAGPGAIINDVALTKDAAWFTDSTQPHLYRVPIGPHGTIGTPTTLVLTGPAADLSGPFVNLNGIAATADGKTLLVAHSGDGTVYTVNPRTGASAAIAGVDVPTVDGILLEADRLWAVQNFLNQVTEFKLSPDLSSATVESVFTSPNFEVPTTVARDGDRLAFVNGKYDTGFPAIATSFEVVVVRR